ncbi:MULTISPECIES: sodium:proton antiporter NhaD [Malaciobacter]|uniref:Sodium:proton antiporter n=2 Tax=Malaciobacter TaxID=2321114 RepID=A0A347TK47_9BACT|nr:MULTISPECIES: sodium:proton antiporter NhaD [Malaciobacter]AXX86975.1 sodium:proton antiporter, NhaD family [Malaciobacter marinus]PHO08986.1 sodium:proton antiporter [Malaciobacter canalis]PHO13153.1 sodium:proton antiporter [Malaciobacter marinus]PHO14105.1 sodium:proton antiporter [Malaciobacter marinus]QEE32760.1 sodium:proton antiporter, NhaD family [Malaciobacter canalis]
MFKIFIILILCVFNVAYATNTEQINLVDTWVGITTLGVFIVGYYVIANEEKYDVDKSLPALFVGIFTFLLIAVYFILNGLDIKLVHEEAENVILEIAEIFFFLFVAMTYIESLIYMGVFDKLKYNLVSKGFTYKKLFWATGFIAFFLSPIADNLTTALILSTVLITIEKQKKEFLVPGAINIVVAANAGGAWSPFGDITTLMVWSSGKGDFLDFIYLFPASIVGYLITAFLLSLVVPNTKPEFDANIPIPKMKEGAKAIIILGILTIVMAVVSHQVLDFPAMWGMMGGLVLLKIYSYKLKKEYGSEHFDIFQSMSKIENNTLMFFFGILAAVGALYFVGWLTLASVIYEPNYLGATYSNIAVGFLSAIVDNVPVMSAILKANPNMDHANWLLVTLTAGIGGSLISFGSAAGVGVMGKLKGIYTFNSHMKYAWMILIGYFVSIAIWYVQFDILKFY